METPPITDHLSEIGPKYEENGPESGSEQADGDPEAQAVWQIMIKNSRLGVCWD